MPITTPFLIVLTATQGAVLTARARSGRTEHRDRVRARIVLAAAGGATNAAIAAETGLACRHRSQVAPPVRPAERLPGPESIGPGPGGRAGSPPVQVAEVNRAGLHPARRDRRRRCRVGSSSDLAAEAVTPRRDRRVDLGLHGAPLAQPRTRSNPGSTGPGSSPATPTSRPRPPGCWTSTPARWDGEPARPGRLRDQRRREIPAPSPAPPPPRHARRAQARPGGSSSSTAAAAPWPTSPPTTSTTPT